MKKLLLFLLVVLFPFLLMGCDDKMEYGNVKLMSLTPYSISKKLSNLDDNKPLNLLNKNPNYSIKPLVNIENSQFIITYVENLIIDITIQLYNPDDDYIYDFKMLTDGICFIENNRIDGETSIRWNSNFNTSATYRVRLEPESAPITKIMITEMRSYSNTNGIEKKKLVDLNEETNANLAEVYIIDANFEISKRSGYLFEKGFERVLFSAKLSDPRNVISNFKLNIRDGEDHSILKQFILNGPIDKVYSLDEYNGEYVEGKEKLRSITSSYNYFEEIIIYGYEIDYKSFYIEVEYDISGYDDIESSDMYKKRTYKVYDEYGCRDTNIVEHLLGFMYNSYNGEYVLNISGEFQYGDLFPNTGSYLNAGLGILNPAKEEYCNTLSIEIYLNDEIDPIFIFKKDKGHDPGFTMLSLKNEQCIDELIRISNYEINGSELKFYCTLKSKVPITGEYRILVDHVPFSKINVGSYEIEDGLLQGWLTLSL